MKKKINELLEILENRLEILLLIEIKKFLGLKQEEVIKLKEIKGSNHVYSFVVKKQKYVAKILKENSIINWEQEKAAYNSLKPLNITDEVVYFENGIKISKYIKSKTLSCSEPDLIKSLDLIRKVHESGCSINYNYDIIGNMKAYIKICNKESKELKELLSFMDKIKKIQALVNNLNIPTVLCHGDACAVSNFLRLSDESIKIIDWEQAGMADPLLDIAIAVLHQGFEKVDPVWCLHQYLKRPPKKQEYFRLFSFLALNSFSLMAWCIYENPDDYSYYLNSAKKYSELVLNYY